MVKASNEPTEDVDNHLKTMGGRTLDMAVKKGLMNHAALHHAE